MQFAEKIYVDGKYYLIKDSNLVKICRGPDYNFNFCKKNGLFARWGKNKKDDPQYSPISGEILDIEVTTICNGKCPWCYKSNISIGKNMSLDMFKLILDKMGSQLTQVAIGADASATSNPYLFDMARYCRSIGVIPNITVSNISEDVAKELASIMGAVSVSNYSKDDCYNSIEMLNEHGLKQINMHFVLCEENMDRCFDTLEDIKNKKIPGLNSIVFLSLKKKGRGKNLNILSKNNYKKIIKYCIDNNINFGMDSCGAVKFLDVVKNNKHYKYFLTIAEPCEAACFSQYVNVDGFFFPCSFCEGTKGWENGIEINQETNYLKDIWYHPRVVSFRENICKNTHNCHEARECPLYKI